MPTSTRSQSLVDKSLVRFTDERYWMLETIREYAADALAASPDAEKLGRRHAEHYLRLALEAEPELAARRRLCGSTDSLTSTTTCVPHSTGH